MVSLGVAYLLILGERGVHFRDLHGGRRGTVVRVRGDSQGQPVPMHLRRESSKEAYKKLWGSLVGGRKRAKRSEAADFVCEESTATLAPGLAAWFRRW